MKQGSKRGDNERKLKEYLKKIEDTKPNKGEATRTS